MKIDKVLNEDIMDAAGKSMDKSLAKAAKSSGGKYFTDLDDPISVLDMAWRENIRQMRNRDPENPNYQPINVLAVGIAGTAKSGIIQDWCRSKGAHLVEFTGSELDTALVQGVAAKTGEEGNEHFKYLPSEVWDELDIPNQRSVLFLDELNRSYAECRAAILSLVQSHKIAGKDVSGKGNKKYLRNFVMTIAAVNPPDETHRGADLLDLAMLTRFYIINWEGKPEKQKAYWMSEMDRQSAQAKKNLEAGVDPDGFEYTKDDYEDDVAIYARRKSLISRLISPDFKYITDSAKLKDSVKKQIGTLNARTLYSAILASDGTDRNFLSLLPGMCGIDTDSDEYKAIKLILKSTPEKDTVENAWKDRTKSVYDRAAAYFR